MVREWGIPTALDARLKNDEGGASAYDLRVMLKILSELGEQIKPMG